MKKIIFLLGTLFLNACIQAPRDVFSEHLNKGESIVVPAQSVEVLDFTHFNDSAHHIENKWPQTPVQMISDWGNENLKASASSDRLIIIIQKAHVVREDLPSPNWYEKDEVKDTLVYQVECVIKSGNKTKRTFTIMGKAFVQMSAKLSLADKEKEWVKLANQMFENLNQQIRLEIKNVV